MFFNFEKTNFLTVTKLRVSYFLYVWEVITRFRVLITKKPIKNAKTLCEKL